MDGTRFSFEMFPEREHAGQEIEERKVKRLQLTFAYTRAWTVPCETYMLSHSPHLSRGTPALCISPVWVTVSRDKLRNSTVRHASRGSEIAIKGINHIYARFFFFSLLFNQSRERFGENQTRGKRSILQGFQWQTCSYMYMNLYTSEMVSKYQSYCYTYSNRSASTFDISLETTCFPSSLDR